MKISLSTGKILQGVFLRSGATGITLFSEQDRMKIRLFFLVILIAGCGDNKTSLDTGSGGGYSYEYVKGDPLGVRIYTLPNGLKVYLSRNLTEPKIATQIAVRAGGKNDPSHATGLAHYLEHIMFKGTADFGTTDWEREKVLLDSIEGLFEQYRGTTDTLKRKALFRNIDAVSAAASRLAIANEYDKIVSTLGANGTNAYTTEDQTVYVNTIPSNQLENWIRLESNRFRMIVPRLFHTELEAVYEEKNISMDEDYSKSYDALNAALFPGHPYGTQTVIGTIEHLKNPSITEIKKFFTTWYRPNNVAICMSGDLDFEKTIALIDRYFGTWKPNQALPKWQPTDLPPITAPVVKEVVGPDADWVTIGYRFPASKADEFPLLQLCDMILSNSQAGIIDMNLKQKQLVLEPISYVNGMTDHSMHVFTGRPRAGQKLEEVRALLLAQVDSLKAGKFEDWLIDAVVNDFRKSRLNGSQYNESRINDMTNAFIKGIPWDQFTSNIDQMAGYTREDIIRFANEHYRDNHVTVYKRNGTGPKPVKIPKPQITAVELNKESVSPFHDSIRTARVEPIEPSFLDFSKDINRSSMNGGIEVISTPNTENELYTLLYVSETGSGTDPRINLAFDYLQYLGTSKHPADWYKREFYRLGINFGVYGGTDQTTIYVAGLSATMEEGLKLFEELIADPRPDKVALQRLVDGVLKQREDAKKDKFMILWNGLVNYGLYGPDSPSTNLLTNDQLKALRPEELTQIIRDLNKVRHRVRYYGPMQPAQVVTVLNHTHRIPEQLADPLPPRKFTMKDVNESAVYWADYDMVQTEIIFVSPGTLFDPAREAEAQLFNEYFGGNMSSPVFQEMRERRALAYSAYAGYATAMEKARRDHLFAYVGTQADKQAEAMNAMMGLMNEFPRSDAGFEVARNSLINRMASTRQVRQGILSAYDRMIKMGIDHDIRKDVYEGALRLTINDIANFHQRMVSGKKFNVLVLGDKDRIDFRALSTYGKVRKLELDELFGFVRKTPVSAPVNP